MTPTYDGPREGHVDVWWSARRWDRPRLILSEGQTHLRRVLQTYGRDLPLERDEFGKPRLTHADDFSFNLSHSGGALVVAVACGDQIGVDCEEIREFPDLLEVAELVCSNREIEQLRRSAGELRLKTFYRMWTGKEAVAKAIGLGMNMSFQEIEVISESTGGTTHTCVAGNACWWVYPLQSPPGLVASCACRRPVKIRYRRIPD